jgi:hypothetical protein
MGKFSEPKYPDSKHDSKLLLPLNNDFLGLLNLKNGIGFLMQNG